MTRGLALFAIFASIACGGDADSKDKKPVKLNRLSKEKSAYLRQHATNPVDWYPWGKEAFDKAKEENKPIFLSIGYSSCHWCHVMEHESFENAEVAKVLNAHFVAIKVDREERPDVDDVYMTAAQLIMRGGGGWPLSVWLTPEGKPFFAGTYFPKAQFIDLLGKVNNVWSDPVKRKRILADATNVTKYVQTVLDGEGTGEIDPKIVETGTLQALASIDPEYGGFGTQPKFPSPTSVEMLLRHGLRTGHEESLAKAKHTLRRMAQGGIHDHIGGGFHRYSVTRDWLVPHFEKMLYDNAQLLGLYARASLIYRDAGFAAVARDISKWVRREMTGEHGAFYAAQDADDPGGPEHEGGFYVWDPTEIKKLFPEAETHRVLLAWFGINEAGNWEHKPGKTLLQTLKSVEDVARASGTDGDAVRRIVAEATPVMYAVREERPKPMTDKKVLAAWNGLMISGFAQAYQALGDEEMLESALGAARFLREKMTREDGRLIRRWADGEAKHDGVLADYAFVTAAYLDLYESTFDVAWLEAALALHKKTVELFHDEKDGGFFFTADGGEKLIARGKPSMDNARPSANGVMAFNLLRFSELTGKKETRELAQKTLERFANSLTRYPLGAATLLNALDFANGPREVFIAGKHDDPATRALIEAVWRNPDRNRVVVLVTPGLEKLLPPAEGKTEVNRRPAAYVCRNFTCKLPETDPLRIAWPGLPKPAQKPPEKPEGPKKPKKPKKPERPEKPEPADEDKDK